MNIDTLLEYTAPSSSDDGEQLKRILAQCWNTPLHQNELYFNRIGLDQFRILRQSDQVLGGLALLPMRQWWGGQRVSVTGIASFGVAPEHREAATAVTLLQHTLRELYTNGSALSLVCAGHPLSHHQAGYEYGGLSSSWQLPVTAIRAPKQELPLQRIEPAQQELLRPLYQQKARHNNGHLERHALIWRRFFQATDKEPVYVYLIGPVQHPQGYVIFSQQTTESGMVLRIRDWTILSPEAGQSFWAFMAHHRSRVQTVRWRSSIIDPLTFYLPESTAQVRRLMRWMLRIVHVKSALEQRGYPLGIEGKLHLDIQDELLTANTGKFILSVANGRGQLVEGGNGEMRLTVRGLALLYTGLLSPQQLQAVGQVQSTESALAVATQLFACSPPWMADVF